MTLAFDETIVVELKFGNKKIFFTLIYSPAYKVGYPELDNFLTNLNNLLNNIANENPYVVFYTGDFNSHSELCGPGGDTNPEGIKIEEITSNFGLSQLINEPSNFGPNKNPTCIGTCRGYGAKISGTCQGLGIGFL